MKHRRGVFLYVSVCDEALLFSVVITKTLPENHGEKVV